ncbi:MAG: ComEC/Rec2 family competence protein [Chloroflexota bacterium]
MTAPTTPVQAATAEQAGLGGSGLGGSAVGAGVVVAASCWSVGIALVGIWDVAPAIAVLAALVALLAAGLAPSAGLRLLALGLAALVLGQARGVLTPGASPDDRLAALAGPVVLTGRIVDEPVPRGARVEAAVEVDGISRSGGGVVPASIEAPRPRILLRAPTIRAGYGDRIETRGRLSAPRERPGWPLAEMLARRGIGWVVDAGGVRVVETSEASLTRWLLAARSAIEASIRAVVPEPQASLVAGIVFGARAGLPPDLKSAMSATGTSHLTAVSGANVAIVAGALLLVVGRWLGRRAASVTAIGGVWLYTLLVGAPPSALRAAAMATVALVAYGLGRQPDALAGLAVSVALLLGWDPGLAFDVGFQLSVAATAGLILFAPSVERRLFWLPAFIRGQVAIAIAAQIATLPIVLGTFQRVSLVSLPANVLAAPTIVPIMALGVALAVFGALPGFDAVLGSLAWLVSSGLLWVIETCASLPGAVVAVGRAPAWLPFVWYAALGCWALGGSADARALGITPGRLRATIAGTATAAVLLVGAVWVGQQRSERVQIALLDREPAAAFIRTPAGRSVLVTTGEAGPGLVASVGAQLDVWESAVDVLVGANGVRTGVDLVSLGDAAQDVDEADLDRPESAGDDDGDASAETERTEGVPPDGIVPGTRVDVGDGVSIQVVDARLVGERRTLDLAIQVDGVEVLLPGQGPPSARWENASSEAATVVALPMSAVSWARAVPPRPWLLLVGPPAREWLGAVSGVTYLTHREYGMVELSVERGTVSIQTERCSAGRDCQLDLARPTVRRLSPES